MGDLINLRQARKAKKRVEGESQAEANRGKYGRTKAEKRLSAMARQKLDAVVDGARRERAED
jgi:hypothetical protein